MEKRLKVIPGCGLCFGIAIFAWIVVANIKVLEIMGAPVLAILIGMLMSTILKGTGRTKPGVTFTSKKILQTAVVLLGFGLNLSTIGRVGGMSMPIIVFTIATSLLVALILQKLMSIPKKTATLIGVGSSICGGSAIAATAPVIDANDEEIAQSISVIFLFNVIAAITFPILGSAFGMSNESFALFAGTAINDTSSVTAAASTWDTMHNTGGTVLEYATIVKLTRTLAIIPIVLALSIHRARKERLNASVKSSKVSVKSLLPMFIIYFVGASILTTVLMEVCSGDVLLAVNNSFSILKKLSKFFIVMAMAAIGLNTNPIKLIKTGAKPIILGLSCWVSIAAVSLLLQAMIGLT
jgi:uncharacterized integral membrane protein (TIGR00698 family)